MNVRLPSIKQSQFITGRAVDRLDRASLVLAGGKGANLGELFRAVFDVPDGFVITTAAYDLLLQTDGLQVKVQAMLVSVQVDNLASVAESSRWIRNAILHAAMPEEIADEAFKAYRQLGSAAVAVRSSTPAEDLLEAAFAGQQETFLNVLGGQALLAALRA